MDKKQAIEEFEHTIELAELKALSNHSLKQPLTDKQHDRMMELGKNVLNVGV